MIFIRGVLGLCPRCGGELSVERHVRAVGPGNMGVDYSIVHPCGYMEERTLDRVEHSQVTNYLRQVSEGLKENGPALSPEEQLLKDFHVTLDLIKTDADLREALGA